mmetsp:Transcript_41516/g.36710  ORF Transcript_41516/g.36710 Transcript_41516/m.36710 type:complete len:105 (+) Transcript_41516:126-440(+)
MPTYQIVAPKKGGARLSQQEFQQCIAALQNKNTLEKANGCTLLSYAWTANATTCYMIVDSKTHFGLSAFLSRILPSGVDLELQIIALVTMQEMQQAIYQTMAKK